MGYIEENLTSDEKIIFTARVHPAIFLPPLLQFAIFIIFLIGTFNSTGTFVTVIRCLILLFGFSAIILGIKMLIIMLTTEFGVTNKRIIAKTGFIRRHSVEILLSKVESIIVNQNIFGRLLNLGTVKITGTGGTSESFRSIAEPVMVRTKINKIIEFYS